MHLNICLSTLFFVLLQYLSESSHMHRQHVNTTRDVNTTECASRRLLGSLFESYDKRIRPYADRRVAVRVHMTIVLGILIEMRENEQVAAYVISHIQRWHDPKLAWNPSEYNGTKELIIPQSMVWLPKMFVYNSMDTKDMLTDDKYDVRVQADGRVKINIPQYVTCICRLYIEQFPFDTQYCAVALASPLLTTAEMDVFSHPPPKDSYFSGNAEWHLTNVSVRHMSFLEEGEYRAEVHYIFQLRRRPVFYITVIVVPIFLISALSILGIFTPSVDNGPRNEKVSLGLGSLLSMTVILGILASAMPKSNSIPLLGYYILVVIILCALAVGLSMCLLTMSRKLVERSRVPSQFTYRIMFLLPKNFTVKSVPRHSIFRPSFSLHVNNTSSVTMANGSLKNVEVNSLKKERIRDPLMRQANSVDSPSESGFQFDDLNKIYRLVRYLAEENRSLKRKNERKKMREAIEKEWSRVFSRLDYMLLIVFQALNGMALLFFLQFAWAPPPPIREPLV
ncbi:unnamed protein product [Bursaphelenchus xylophilus]|uniref:(pine wood nematode) hypothetical protein n=1 Tax=Bursaphelenchus xylophilus TaxID=6326 RepID=A0A1I7RMB1_BURXY|nr:unnamed protein product [Bursaphelenchus xylophilus]CAG9118346.1 unnamed protein product [Bursaphelenchus xylophilus]